MDEMTQEQQQIAQLQAENEQLRQDFTEIKQLLARVANATEREQREESDFFSAQARGRARAAEQLETEQLKQSPRYQYEPEPMPDREQLLARFRQLQAMPLRDLAAQQEMLDLREQISRAVVPGYTETNDRAQRATPEEHKAFMRQYAGRVAGW